MKNLKIFATTSTPLIDFKYDEGELRFEGRCFVEHPGEFFKDIEEWIYDYLKNPKEETDVIFKLDFLNTNSSKIIYKIIKALSSLDNITFTVYFEEDDEDMIKLFKNYETILGLHFNNVLIMY